MASLALARSKALELLDRYGVEEPRHIRATDLAEAEGLRVKYGELGSAAARLTLLRGRGFIRMPEEQRGQPWARFGIAHELGHYVLHQGSDGFCTKAEIDGWGASEHREEEANAFAAELLMPQWMVLERCGVEEPSLEAVWLISRTFRVSFPAAAARLVELTPAACAFALSVAGRLRWFRASASWPFSPLAPRAQLDARALAVRWWGTGRAGKEGVPLEVWAPGAPQGTWAMEACIDAQVYGRAVSLVSLPTMHQSVAPSSCVCPSDQRGIVATADQRAPRRY